MIYKDSRTGIIKTKGMDETYELLLEDTYIEKDYTDIINWIDTFSGKEVCITIEVLKDKNV